MVTSLYWDKKYVQFGACFIVGLKSSTSLDVYLGVKPSVATSSPPASSLSEEQFSEHMGALQKHDSTSTPKKKSSKTSEVEEEEEENDGSVMTGTICILGAVHLRVHTITTHEQSTAVPY